MSIKTPTCAVIIVTHNSQLHIHKAMQCLKQQTCQADQIVIVDSGSSETDYLLPYNHSNTSVILAGSDIGFCKGNNIGFSRIPPHCDYVFFLNPDAFLTPHFLEGAIAFMEHRENQNYSALTGTVQGYEMANDKPTGLYDSTGVFRKWYGKWYDRAQGMKCELNSFQVQEDVPAICGAVLFCRKKALDSVLIRGGEVLDQTFFMYKEDIDLALRLRKKGWKLAFVPHLMAYHCRGWNRDRSKMPRRMRLSSSRNEMRVQARNRSAIGMCYSFLKYAAVKLFDI